MSEASPRASRLATPRWLDGRLVLGVMMVLFAVVAGARVFAAADRYAEVYVARGALVPGEHLSASDVSVGQVRFNGEGREYVAATTPPVGYVVTRYVAAGELIPVGAVSAATPNVLQSRLVTVPVQAGHVPGNLGHGDLVDVYLTAKSPGGNVADPVLVLGAVPVEAYDDGSGALSGSTAVSVVLDVPSSKVGRIVAAVERGTIDLVRLPDVAAAAVSPPTPAPAGRATPTGQP